MTTKTRVALPALLLAATLALGACDDSLTEVNQNPNAPTGVPAAALLPEAIGQTGDLVWDSFWHMYIWGTWTQNTALIQYPDEERYDVRVSEPGVFWEAFYDGPLKDFQTVAQRGAEAGNPNVQAIGLIMKSYIFNMVADAWGPAPYSEALRLEEDIQTPAYDPGRTIYEGVLADLEQAVSLIQPGDVPPSLPNNDVLYGGDMEKWRRFANSLRLKMAMRMSSVDEAAATPIVQSAISSGVFQSNADAAKLDYPGGQNRNPIYVDGLTRDDHAPGEPMLSRMREWRDPRTPVYAKPCPNCSPDDPWDVKYIGGTIARGGEPRPLGDIARIGAFWRNDPSASQWFMTYAEVEFFKAEAAMRGMISGDPGSYYESGIRASMNQYGITGAEVDDYLQEEGVAWAGGTDAMQKIGVQKWIALYMGGSALEAYSEIRRLGYPAITPGPQALNVNNGHPPTRMPYPPIEQSLNNQSLQDAISLLGGDNMSATLFWDTDGQVP